MVDLAAAMTACQTAVGENTVDNRTLVWNCYTKHCKSIGHSDYLFLKGMSQTHKIKIMRSFAMALQ
jgi:hypothetical protein